VTEGTEKNSHRPGARREDISAEQQRAMRTKFSLYNALDLVMLQAMPPQPVVAKVIARRTQHGVNVIRIVGKLVVIGRDNVVVFDQHGGAVDAIVHGFPRFRRPHPREMHFVEPGRLDRGAIVAGHVGPQIAQILLDERFE